MSTPSDFELEQWEKDAKRLVICTGCYGSGENRWEQGRACPTCNGLGKSAAEPHVLQMLALIRKQRTSYIEGAEAMRKAIREALKSAYDAGIQGVVATMPIPEREIT